MDLEPGDEDAVVQETTKGLTGGGLTAGGLTGGGLTAGGLTGLQQLLLSGDDQTSGTRTKVPPQPHTTCWFGFNVRNPLNLLWTAVAS